MVWIFTHKVILIFWEMVRLQQASARDTEKRILTCVRKMEFPLSWPVTETSCSPLKSALSQHPHLSMGLNLIIFIYIIGLFSAIS